MQDIEKWRARESTWINFSVFYWYKILAGIFHYRVRPMPQASAAKSWCVGVCGAEADFGRGTLECTESDALSKAATCTVVNTAVPRAPWLCITACPAVCLGAAHLKVLDLEP